MEIKRSCVVMNRQIKDAYYTVQNFHYSLKLFALEWTVRRNSALETNYSPCRTAFTAVTLGALSIASIYVKATYFYGDLDASITVTDVGQNIFDYLQYLVDLYFVYKYGRVCKLEYFNYYKNIDDLLRFRNYSNVRKEVNTLSLLFIIAALFSVFFDFVSWMLSYSWQRPISFAIAYIFTLIKTLNFLDLISNVLNLEYRLGMISDKLEGYYCRATCKRSFTFTDPITNIKWIHNDCIKDCNEKYLSNIFCVGAKSQQETRSLSKCYLILWEQCTYINTMFGLRILLNFVSLLIDMIRFINVAVRIMVGSQQTEYESHGLPSIANVLRFLVFAVLLLSLVHHCERSYRQRDRMLRILDYIFINKDIDVEFRASLEELRNLVSSRPLDFHLVHFFRLDYSLLCSISSVIVTYTIIMTQN